MAARRRLEEGRAIGGLRALAAFAYDFVVGDEWRLAAGAVLLVGVVALLVAVGVNAWWLGPVALPLILLAARPPKRPVSCP